MIWRSLTKHVSKARRSRTCLVAVDVHWKWPEVVEMSTTTASQTVTVLRRMFVANGLPKQLVTENGPQFVSEEFDSFCVSVVQMGLNTFM